MTFLIKSNSFEGDETVKAFQRSNGEFLFKFRIGVGADETSEVSAEGVGEVTDDNCGCPWGIHWTMDETLLVGDIRFDYIYIVDKRGKRLGRFGGPGRSPNKFNGPMHICSDGDGNVAVADAKVRHENPRVRSPA